MLALLAAASARRRRSRAPARSVVARTDPSIVARRVRARSRIIITNLGDEPVVAGTTNPLVISDRLPASSHRLGDRAAPQLPRRDKRTGNARREARVQDLADAELQASSARSSRTARSHSSRSPRESIRGRRQRSVGSGRQRPGHAPDAESRRAKRRCRSGSNASNSSPKKKTAQPDNLAGSHPFALTTTLELNQIFKARSASRPVGARAAEEPQHGAAGRADREPAGRARSARKPTSKPKRLGNSNLSPANTAVGVAVVTFKAEPSRFAWPTKPVPVFNLAPAEGEPARLGFEFVGCR